jgi:hypothetical protein
MVPATTDGSEQAEKGKVELSIVGKVLSNRHGLRAQHGCDWTEGPTFCGHSIPLPYE